MRKPDAIFLVTVTPVYDVHGCQEKRDQEARGSFGFHLYQSCPNCRVVFRGWEMWGSNGHMQAALSTRDQMRHWIKIKAREQWPMKHGATAGRLVMGYKFRVGSPMYYKGPWNLPTATEVKP